MLARCSRHMQHGQVEPLTEADRLAIAIASDRMASEALRLLGAAYRECEDATEEASPRLEDLTLAWLDWHG